MAEEKDVLTHVNYRSRKIIVRGVQEQPLGIKPKGFWYSVDGDWERWCSSEMPKWLDGAYVHRVSLGDENILRIKTDEDLYRFHFRYSAAPSIGLLQYIDWRKVSDEFDGIEISPYLNERRFDRDMVWYYSWDCASGCVWRPKGIKVNLISPCKILKS